MIGQGAPFQLFVVQIDGQDVPQPIGVERFDPEQFRVRESPSEPVVPFEHEHEDDLRRGKRRSLTTALFRERLFTDVGRLFDLSLFSRPYSCQQSESHTQSCFRAGNLNSGFHSHVKLSWFLNPDY